MDLFIQQPINYEHNSTTYAKIDLTVIHIKETTYFRKA